MPKPTRPMYPPGSMTWRDMQNFRPWTDLAAEILAALILAACILIPLYCEATK